MLHLWGVFGLEKASRCGKPVSYRAFRFTIDRGEAVAARWGGAPTHQARRDGMEVASHVGMKEVIRNRRH